MIHQLHPLLTASKNGQYPVALNLKGVKILQYDVTHIDQPNRTNARAIGATKVPGCCFEMDEPEIVIKKALMYLSVDYPEGTYNPEDLEIVLLDMPEPIYYDAIEDIEYYNTCDYFYYYEET